MIQAWARDDLELVHGAAAHKLRTRNLSLAMLTEVRRWQLMRVRDLEHHTVRDHAFDRRVGDIGVAEEERAEAGEPRRGEQDGAEADPGTRRQGASSPAESSSRHDKMEGGERVWVPSWMWSGFN